MDGHGDASRRAAWMGLLARARPEALADALAALGPEPAHALARPPETGLVMTRGRAGGAGAPFNLGETTATRCAVRLADGTDGVAYVLGRDREHARRAALADALLQGPQAERVRLAVLAPLEAEERARRESAARRAAATRVEFFTLARDRT